MMTPEPAPGDLEDVPALPKPQFWVKQRSHYFFLGTTELPFDSSGQIIPEASLCPSLQGSWAL